MKIRARRVVAGAAVIAVSLGLLAPVAASAESQDRAELQKVLDKVSGIGGAGIQLRLHDAHGDWVGRAGVAETGTTRPVPTDGHFRAGSITKTFIATVILQLNAERRVDLDAPVNRYLPGYLPADSKITVRNLLQHTSGLYNYTGESATEPGIIPLEGKGFLEHRFQTITPDEILKWAVAKPVRFQPGEGWSYSNTNYIMLGQLIQKLTGHSYAEEADWRILRPLGLRDTSFPGTRFDIPGRHAHGYFGYRDGEQLKIVDVTRLNPSWGGSAGEIISTTKDLDRFYDALLGGKLLPAAQLKAMMTGRHIEGFGDYGLGLYSIPTSCGDFWGHSGGIHGYSSFAFVKADRSVRMEYSITGDGRDDVPPGEAQKVGEELVEKSLCGK
ncbi:class A beta-lactamase-related serine hydrolase [Pseudonocardiaceae bacterium YIM PH 21723]|nr:class A beta-lactamase-related serine hydrolase [Pseudonocardiaceae bacterium YIM PH 21723]